MKLEGVPQSVTVGQLQEMMGIIGIDVNDVTGDGVQIYFDGIECEVFARNTEGERFLRGDRVATHRVVIPIERNA